MWARARWWVALFLALACDGVAYPQGGEAVDPAWLVKARTEIKALYGKYQALSPRLEAECEYRSDKAPGSVGTIPFRPHTRRERTVRLGDNIILEQTRILDGAPNRPQIRLQCDNSDYHFTLSKSREDAPYALVEYAPGKRKLPLINQGSAQGWQNQGFSYLHAALGAIENDGKHTLRALQFEDAKGLLRIEYTTAAGDSSIIKDQIYVDPTHGWRVVERQVETPSASGTDRWNYGVTVGGLEFPTEFKNQTTYKVAKAPPNMEITGRLINLKVTDKTPDDFRLSAFGIPEPVDVAPPPKRTRWYLWLLVAAGACAALSFGFAYLRRRRRQARSTPPPVHGVKA